MAIACELEGVDRDPAVLGALLSSADDPEALATLVQVFQRQARDLGPLALQEQALRLALL